MIKRIISKEKLFPKMKEGMADIAGIVKRTLGPGGQPILLERRGQSPNGDPLGPKITKDGVSVADECFDPDPEKDIIIQAVKSICRKTNTMAGDGPQPLYSKVLTPKGFIPMDAVKVGMEICGTNGSTQTVLGVFPKGEKEIYQVTFANGKQVECCEEHLWKVVDYKGEEELLTTQTIKSAMREDYESFYIKPTLAEYPDNLEEMPFDPYFAGILLAKGFTQNGDSFSILLNTNESLNNVKVPSGVYLETTKIEGLEYSEIKFSNKGNNPINPSTFFALLMLCVGSKEIPTCYLWGSRKTREALLQGMMDSSSLSKTGKFDLLCSSPNLAKNLVSLARSLGRTFITVPGTISQIIRVLEVTGAANVDTIVDVTKTGRTTAMQCIKVSNPDSLYITDDFVVTHNTTTAIVLGEALLNETLSELESNKALNPQLVRESVELASKEVLAELKKLAQPVKDHKTISQVATISANGEVEIGEIIGKAFEKVGAEGVVVVDEGSGNTTTLDIVEGYQVQRGAEFRDVFFNNPDKTQFEAKDVRLLIFDGKLVNFTSLRPILLKLAQSNLVNGHPVMPPVVIMANDFSTEVIQWLLIQKSDAGMQFCAVKGPNTTNIRSGYYDDIAAMSGGTRLGNGGASLESADLENLGEVDRAVIDKYTTTFYDGQGDEAEVLARVEQLKAMRNRAESPYDEQIFTDRIAALTQGIAKIGVGGATDLEIKEKYDRIEDALNAARAAIEEGVIPGGGTTLLRIATEMSAKSIGHKILKQALKTPFYQILANIEHEITQAEFEAVMRDPNAVYDARHKKVENAITAGILDPVKVCRTAFENAVSISTLLSTAGGGIIYDKDVK
jgi:chaperonin GroEL